MRKTLGFLVVIASLTLLVHGVFAVGTARIPVRVPFDFYVDGTNMPAGDYTLEITPYGATGSFSLLVIRDGKGEAGPALFVRRQKNENPDISGLTFNRYGKTSFLTTVSVGRHQADLGMSASEREMLTLHRTPSMIRVAQK
jgi:hypothetical protein